MIPSVCYPTYEVGARLAGASVVRADSLLALGPARVAWSGSTRPATRTVGCCPPAHLRKVVEWARERGALVVSDECYLELGWDATPVSVLSVCGGAYDGVLAVHSLSKRSNLAGYRAGFVAGDPAVVAELLEVRKHAGLIVPAPVQAAMVAALTMSPMWTSSGSATVPAGSLLRSALAGGRLHHRPLRGRALPVGHPGRRVLVHCGLVRRAGHSAAPGSFYGPAGARHVRLALTATDERIATAASRIAA